jgi:hypothetical protein
VTNAGGRRWFTALAVMPPSRSHAVASCAVALASILAAGCTGRPARDVAAAPARPAAAAPAASAGLRVYRDPVTGAFTEPPAAAAPARAAQQAGAPAPLVETAAPGGGTMIKLNGAFRSQVRARAGAGGAAVSCAAAAR